MLGEEEARELLYQYAPDDHWNVRGHCEAVANFLYDISRRLAKRRPDLGIIPDEMKVAGLLHDIGKDRDPTWHAIVGARLLTDLGHPDIADVIRTHGSTHELAAAANMEGDYLPITLPQKLVAYADIHVMGCKVVEFEERMADCIARTDPNEGRGPAIRRAAERLRNLVDEINVLLYE